MHRLQAYMTSAEWGSQALAGLAGTAAWWHGTDPAWWMQTMNTWPEPFPWEMAAQAQAWYDGQSQVVLASAPTPKEPYKPPSTEQFVCSMRCLIRNLFNLPGQTKCMVEECGISPERLGPIGRKEYELSKAPANLVATVIGVGLVLIGAYALVR